MSQYEPTMDADQLIPIVYHHDTITPEYNHPNWHTNLEILYIKEGEGSVFCGSHTYDAHAGNVFVINANNIHSVTSKHLMKSTCFIIDNNFCISNGIPVESLEFTTQIKSEELTVLCENLIFELDNFSSFQAAAIRCALLNLMLCLAKNHSQTSTIAYSSNESLKLAMGYMKAHFNQNISLDEIAYEAGLSKFYFSREFKKVTGMTPVTYINSLRCNEAKKLLKKNKFTIKEISEKCGFYNYSYFTKTFKKHIGTLPSEYAKKTTLRLFFHFFR